MNRIIFTSCLRKQKGAILVGLVVMMISVAILGGGMLYFTTTSTFGELMANNNARGYYLAEAGGRYAISILKTNSTAFPGGNKLSGDSPTIYTLSNGAQFILTSYEPDPQPDPNTPSIVVESTGVVKSGTGQQARIKITYVLVRSSPDSSSTEPVTTDVSFEGNDPDDDLDTIWDSNFDGADAVIVNTTDGPALMFKGTESGIISLDWQANPDVLDLATSWLNNRELLSYDIQVKVNIASKDKKLDYYMFGLSFRLDTIENLYPADDNSYGVSFFHAKAEDDNKTPDWIKSADFATFSSLRNPNIYIVLWKKTSGTYSLLDYKQMTEAEGVIDSSGNLKAWSAIVVRLVEQFDGNGVRQNHIKVYVQGTDTYPRNTINWTFANFNTVMWTQYSGIFYKAWTSSTSYSLGDTIVPTPKNGHCYVCTSAGISGISQPSWPTARSARVTDGTIIWTESTKIVDGTFTSENFDTRRPDEIGVHAFYDSNAANDQFFDDFAMRVVGAGDGSGLIQY